MEFSVEMLSLFSGCWPQTDGASVSDRPCELIRGLKPFGLDGHRQTTLCLLSFSTLIFPMGRIYSSLFAAPAETREHQTAHIHDFFHAWTSALSRFIFQPSVLILQASREESRGNGDTANMEQLLGGTCVFLLFTYTERHLAFWQKVSLNTQLFLT